MKLRETLLVRHYFYSVIKKISSSSLSCSYSLAVFSSTVHTAFQVGKIQVSMRKQVKQKWTSLGQQLEFHNTFLCKKDRGEIQDQRKSVTEVCYTPLHLFAAYYMNFGDVPCGTHTDRRHKGI